MILDAKHANKNHDDCIEEKAASIDVIEQHMNAAGGMNSLHFVLLLS